MSWKIRYESIMYDCPHRRWYEITSGDEVEYFCYEPNYGKGETKCNEAECPLRVVDDDKEAGKDVAYEFGPKIELGHYSVNKNRRLRKEGGNND